MKKITFLLILLLLINFINTKSTSNNEKKSHHNLLRNLWEEDMNYPKNRAPEDEASLNRCGKSSYKYFSYIVTGANMTYSHLLTSSIGGVRK